MAEGLDDLNALEAVAFDRAKLLMDSALAHASAKYPSLTTIQKHETARVLVLATMGYVSGMITTVAIKDVEAEMVQHRDEGTA